MIPALQFLVQNTHSYGLSIVLLTLAVRAVVWPFVSSSTKNMQRMQLISPKMEEFKQKYKDDPELMQRKVMEFYARNKVNPLSGCLPMLIQLPILFALFATFNGPPFSDRPIDVKVNVVEAKDASKVNRKETSGGNSAYVSEKGDLAKVVVFPGESTVLVGDKLDFGTRAVEGNLPSDFKANWVVKMSGKPANEADAKISESGEAVFNKPGEYHVEAIVHGIAKNDSFLFINSLGKTATGFALLDPHNYDLLGLIIFFGASMWLSSKLTMGNQDKSKMSEQQLAQMESMKLMPVMMTGVFVFTPLPTGVYLYMAVSNIFQTVQTWLLMRTPPPPLVDVDDSPMAGAASFAGAGPFAAPGGGSGFGVAYGGGPKTIDVTPAPKNGNGSTEGNNGASKSSQAEDAGMTIDVSKSKKKKKK